MRKNHDEKIETQLEQSLCPFLLGEFKKGRSMIRDALLAPTRSPPTCPGRSRRSRPLNQRGRLPLILFRLLLRLPRRLPSVGALCRTCIERPQVQWSGALEMILCDACDYARRLADRPANYRQMWYTLTHNHKPHSFVGNKMPETLFTVMNTPSCCPAVRSSAI